MVLKSPTLIAAALTLALACGAAGAAEGNLATVNGVAVPQARLDVMMKALVAAKQPDSPEVRKEIRERIINQEVIAQEAQRRGIQKNPEVAAQLDLQRQELLVNAYIQEYVRTNPVTDDIMRKEYERIKPTIPAKEFKARHILVEKEDEAKDILAQIRKGGSFEKLAAERSKDPGSKTRGGDLDWGPAARYTKNFAEALNKMKKGQMSEAPVQTEFGWHIIRVDDERATQIPTFEEAKPQIQQMMQGQVVQKMLADLRAKAKID